MKDRIKKIRKELDLTQQKFADRLSVKRNTVAQWELGINTLTNQVIMSICREFNVDYIWLTTDDIVADMIKEIIIMYGKLDNNSKQVIKSATKNLLDKIKNT